MLIRPSTIIGVSIVMKRSRFAIAVFVFKPVYSYVMWDHFVNTCTQVGPKIPGNSTGGGIRQSLNLFAIRRMRRDKTDPVIRPTMILKYFGRSLLGPGKVGGDPRSKIRTFWVIFGSDAR